MKVPDSITFMDERELKRRLRLLMDWNFTCIVCGEQFDNMTCVTLEHNIPKSMGGNQGENIAPSHYNCNKWRGTKSLIEADMTLKFKRRHMGEASFRVWLSRPVPDRLVTPLALYDIQTIILMLKD